MGATAQQQAELDALDWADAIDPNSPRVRQDIPAAGDGKIATVDFPATGTSDLAPLTFKSTAVGAPTPAQQAELDALDAADAKSASSNADADPDAIDIPQHVSAALMPAADAHLPYDPNAVADKYKDMGDFMRMPSIWKDFSSNPMSALGLIGSDADSFEKIIKKNYKGIDIRKEKDGSLVMHDYADPDPKKEYVFKKGSFQQGDFIRMLMGVPITAGATAALAPLTVAGGATAAAALPAWAVGTGGAMLGQFMLSKLREKAGGSTVSPWEIAAAAALHGAFHKVGQWWRGPEPGPQTAQQLSENAVAAARGSNASAESMLGQMQPKAAVVQAADRLGVGDSLTPGQVSENPIFQQMSATAMGNESDTARVNALRRVSDAFEKGIKEGGGPGSQDAMEAIRKNSEEMLAESAEGVRTAYKPETIGVPKDAPTPVNNLLGQVDAKIAAYKGAAPPKDLLKIRAKLTTADGSPPGWEVVDDVMKDLGASSKGKPPYKSLQASGVLGDFIEAGKSDQQLAANEFPGGDGLAGERFLAAKVKFQEHLALKNAYRSVMANVARSGLAGEVVPAIGMLGNGVPDSYNKAMSMMRPKDRVTATLAGMYQFIKETATGDTLMDARKYVNFMDGLERNEASKNALFAHLPDAFKQTMKDTHEVTKAILESSRITPGAFEHEFKDRLSPMDRLKSAATAIPKAIGFVALKLPAAFGFDVAGDLIGKPDPLQPLVRKILTSPLAKEAMRRQVSGAPISDGFVRNFMNSTPVRAFMASAPDLARATQAQRFDYMRNALGNTKFNEQEVQ